MHKKDVAMLSIFKLCFFVLFVYSRQHTYNVYALAGNDSKPSVGGRHEHDESLHSKSNDIVVFVLSNTDHQGLMLRDR